MSSEIIPGDVVVCVDDSPCKCCGDDLGIPLRSHHRVLQVGRARNRRTGDWVDTLHFPGIRETQRHPAKWGVNAARFRKILPGKMEFIGLTEREREDA